MMCILNRQVSDKDQQERTLWKQLQYMTNEDISQFKASKRGCENILRMFHMRKVTCVHSTFHDQFSIGMRAVSRLMYPLEE